MKIWPAMEQRSEAWFRARAGRLTASNFFRVLTPTGKDSSQWRALAIEMCCSRIRPDEIQWEGNRRTGRIQPNHGDGSGTGGIYRPG